MRAGVILGIPYQVQPAWLLIFAIVIVTFISTLGGGGAATLISPTMTVATLLEQDRQRGGSGAYPVIDGGVMTGIVFTARLGGPLRRSRPDRPVSEVAVPLDRAPTFGPDDPLIGAVERLETLRTDSLPVVDPDEPARLYGVVTRQKVLQRLRIRHRLIQARDGSASPGERG